jgi:hypothetical protein
VDYFLSKHVKLNALATERGTSAKAMAKEIEAERATPILPKTRLGCQMYRRADFYAVKICVSKSGSSTWEYEWGRKPKPNRSAQPKVGYRIAD